LRARQVSHALAAPTAGVYRVAANPWLFAFSVPRSALIDDSEPVLGGNRWDDPRGSFATLYCASSAEAAFAETIARYREVPGLLERLAAFLTGTPDAEYDFELKPGQVPEDYFDNRYLGHIAVDDDVRFVDVEHPDTHIAARPALRPLLRGYGIRRIDRGTFLHADRRVTRTIARYYLLLGARAIPGPSQLARPSLQQPARCGLGMLGGVGTHPASRRDRRDHPRHARQPRLARSRRTARPDRLGDSLLARRVRGRRRLRLLGARGSGPDGCCSAVHRDLAMTVRGRRSTLRTNSPARCPAPEQR
jgi:hypothetical protein